MAGLVPAISLRRTRTILIGITGLDASRRPGDDERRLMTREG
jgi:hypothetical protein